MWSMLFINVILNERTQRTFLYEIKHYILFTFLDLYFRLRKMYFRLFCFIHKQY